MLHCPPFQCSISGCSTPPLKESPTAQILRAETAATAFKCLNGGAPAAPATPAFKSRAANMATITHKNVDALRKRFMIFPPYLRISGYLIDEDHYRRKISYS